MTRDKLRCVRKHSEPSDTEKNSVALYHAGSVRPYHTGHRKVKTRPPVWFQDGCNMRGMILMILDLSTITL